MQTFIHCSFFLGVEEKNKVVNVHTPRKMYSVKDKIIMNEFNVHGGSIYI